MRPAEFTAVSGMSEGPAVLQGPDDSTEGQGDTFARYCDDVEKTAAWGGDMELNALAEGLQRHIQLHSVGMPPVEFGAPYKGELSLLC